MDLARISYLNLSDAILDCALFASGTTTPDGGRLGVYTSTISSFKKTIRGAY
jgi:hypothetical protein